MKILIVSPTFGAFGGIEAFVLALASELKKQGMPFVICFKRVKGFKLDPNFDRVIARSGFKVVFVDRASAELLRLIRSSDLVHCQNPSLDVAVFAKLLGKKLVVTIYGWKGHFSGIHKLVSVMALSLADRTCFISKFVWDSWEPARKRPSSHHVPTVSDLPEGMLPSHERKGFLFISRWIANKGLEELIEAYARARIDRNVWPLVLVGKGPLRVQVESKIRDGKMEGIQIRGFLGKKEKDDAIRHAKWMVTPPHTNEDLGLTPIEARHVGVPCIVTRDGGLPEAAGVHSLSCEPGNVEQLKALLEKAAGMDEQEYRRLSQATYEELLRFLKPLSFYSEMYSSLLKR